MTRFPTESEAAWMVEAFNQVAEILARPESWVEEAAR